MRMFLAVRLSLLLVAWTPALVLSADAGSAHKIQVQDCWIRLLPGKLPSAAYMRVVNAGNEDVVLTSAGTSAYARTMLHTTTQSQGMSRMQHVHQVVVPAQGQVEFAPGGLHVMLEDATREVRVGDAIPLVLAFSQGQSVEVDCAVRAANAVQREHQHPHSHPHKH